MSQSAREHLSALLVALATGWLGGVIVLGNVDRQPALDSLVLVLGLVVQLLVVSAWAAFARLPLWLVAGHGLIMVSLAIGMLISAPALAEAPQFMSLPARPLVVGLVPTGLVMVIAPALRWRPPAGLVH